MKQVRLDKRTLNAGFVDFAEHYAFSIRTHRPFRPQTKGKVERMVGYVKSNFLNARQFADLDDLNTQARVWLEQTANTRIHQTTHHRPSDLLPKENLIAASSIGHYRITEYSNRIVNSEARVLYEHSHYSVPAIAVGQNVTVQACPNNITIRLGDTIIAEHIRSQTPGQHVVLEHHLKEHWDHVLAQASLKRTVAPCWSIGRISAVEQRSLSVYQEVL